MYQLPEETNQPVSMAAHPGDVPGRAWRLGLRAQSTSLDAIPGG